MVYGTCSWATRARYYLVYLLLGYPGPVLSWCTQAGLPGPGSTLVYPGWLPGPCTTLPWVHYPAQTALLYPGYTTLPYPVLGTTLPCVPWRFLGFPAPARRSGGHA